MTDRSSFPAEGNARDAWGASACRSRYLRFGKRLLDVVGAVAALVVLSPIIAAVTLLVLAVLGRPVFFRQSRPGLLGRPFTLVKFRTMRDDVVEPGCPAPDERRLTRIGRFLRHSSLDELPELVNVLAGHMSLVGPRPLLMEYLERYTQEQARRHRVRPGLTGWAQVNGRNALTWEERFRLDVWYVDHVCLSLDLTILVMTLVEVFKARGISAADHATMPKFSGTKGTNDGE